MKKEEQKNEIEATKKEIKNPHEEIGRSYLSG